MSLTPRGEREKESLQATSRANRRGKEQSAQSNCIHHYWIGTQTTQRYEEIETSQPDQQIVLPN